MSLLVNDTTAINVVRFPAISRLVDTIRPMRASVNDDNNKLEKRYLDSDSDRWRHKASRRSISIWRRRCSRRFSSRMCFSSWA